MSIQMGIVCRSDHDRDRTIRRSSSGRSAVRPRVESHTLTLDAADLDALLQLARASTASEARREAARLRALLGEDAARIATHIDALVARARELERNRRMAATDPLTRAANRRALDDALRRELARSQRSRKPLSLLLLDLDGLKAINDTFGHAAGDRALRAVARCARQVVRRCDLVARIGGDEFAVLLPETDAAGARAIGQRIRSKLAEASTSSLPLRLSLGVARARHALLESQELLETADAELYRDKVARRSIRPREWLVPIE
jgi:diguanylate cyclase (GGDEF)-like protein